MADDLSNYKLQLQQVEVALLTDPDNAELLKLKDDIGKKLFSQKHEQKLIYLLCRSTSYASKGIDQNTRRRTTEIRRAIKFRCGGKSSLLQRSESQEPVAENLEGWR